MPAPAGSQRDPKPWANPKAKSLAARGVELVKGDFDDVASLRKALAGVSAAFSVQQWTEKGGTEAEELHGKRFADAVKASGSPHLVYSSAEGAERNSGLAHYESKWAIEQHIRELGLPATILRPVGFMDAFGVASDPARNVPRNIQSELWPISPASSSWPPTTSVGLLRARSKSRRNTPDALFRSPGIS